MARTLLLTLFIALLSTGCAEVPYHYGPTHDLPSSPILPSDETQIERGQPNAWVDGFGHYLFSLPSKLFLWSTKVDNHNISPETEETVRRYLEENNLKNVKVRINQYSPGDEWWRLVHNDEVRGFWRYTFGVLTTASYTILPGRLFGGDNYNPFTNTLNIYSDSPAIALHEASHAKDFQGRRNKGPYAAIRAAPILPLYQEAVATSDTVSYTKEKKDTEKEKESYKVLYPAYGTYIAGEGLALANFFGPISYGTQLAVQAAIVIPGHAIGRVKAAMVEEAPAEPPAPTPDPASAAVTVSSAARIGEGEPKQ